MMFLGFSQWTRIKNAETPQQPGDLLTGDTL